MRESIRAGTLTPISIASGGPTWRTFGYAPQFVAGPLAIKWAKEKGYRIPGPLSAPKEELTVTDAARLLVSELRDEITLPNATKRISEACSKGILKHSGEKGKRRMSSENLADFLRTARVKTRLRADTETESLSRSIVKTPERAKSLAETAKKMP